MSEARSAANTTSLWATNLVGGPRHAPVYPQSAPTNTLFYGDNLDILREYIADASIDLVCLDLFDRAYRTRYTPLLLSTLPYRCTSRSQTCPLGTNRRSSGK